METDYPAATKFAFDLGIWCMDEVLKCWKITESV